MLERLDEVPWSTLTHAYGSAADVPELLRGLASADPDEREAVLSELHGNVWHQGTVYPATPHVVPFLLELLAEPELPARGDLLLYVRRLARGTPRARSGPAHAQATVAAVRRGAPIYEVLLDDPDPDVGLAAAALLGDLELPDATAALLRFEASRGTVRERVGALLALVGPGDMDDGEQDGDGPADTGAGSIARAGTNPEVAALLERRRADGEPGVRVAAAIATARLARAATPPAAAELLVGGLADAPLLALIETLPEVEDAWELLVEALRLAGPVGRAALLRLDPGALAQYGELRAGELLDLALGPERRVGPADLDDVTRTVLRVVAAANGAWAGGEPASTLGGQLFDRGLPDDRDALRVVAAGGPLPPASPLPDFSDESASEPLAAPEQGERLLLSAALGLSLAFLALVALLVLLILSTA